VVDAIISVVTLVKYKGLLFCQRTQEGPVWRVMVRFDEIHHHLDSLCSASRPRLRASIIRGAAMEKSSQETILVPPLRL